MNFTFDTYPYSDKELDERLAAIAQKPLENFSQSDAFRLILNCIDLTTLEGSDNVAKITELCNTALCFKDEERKIQSPAAVCVYPPFVKQACTLLKGSGIKIASVAGAFPSGQSPIDIKLAEVRFAVEQGADEIDMVISRGKFLEGDYQTVYDEIVAIKKCCNHAHLKVILETGELQTAENIYRASQLAIMAGADFIKTSTGKIAVNATPKSFLIMLDSIKNYYQKTGNCIGIKPAGGISDPETALLYLKVLENVMGSKWLINQYFRIGASRLAKKIADII